MSNNKHTLVPKLRFPEFQNEGEWEVKKLGEVLEKNKEKNKDRKYTLVQSVSNKFGFINQDEYFENRIVASKDTSNYYVIRKGCFAYNPSRIDVGSLAYKNDENISIISPLYVSFKAKNDKVLDLYLLNWFRSNGFIEQMILEGGVRNTLNFDNLIEISIPLPSLPEQEKIASCLSSLDEVITGEQQKLELLKQHKKGLLQNLFPQEGETVPKIRFKEFENSGEWEVKKLGEIGDFFNGGTPDTKNEDYWNGDILWFTPSEIKKKYLKESNRKITELGLKNSSAKLLPKGSILITTRATIGDVGIALEECTTNQGFQSLVVKQNNSNEFWYYYIFNSKSELDKRASGSTFKEITKSKIISIPVLAPSFPEQQKIASCLSSLDELISAQTQKIEQLQRHKKGLLQGLFPNVNNL